MPILKFFSPSYCEITSAKKLLTVTLLKNPCISVSCTLTRVYIYIYKRHWHACMCVWLEWHTGFAASLAELFFFLNVIHCYRLSCFSGLYSSADKSLVLPGRKQATSMSQSSWMVDPTHSREMPSCSALDLSEIRRSSFISLWIWSIISRVVGLRTYQHPSMCFFFLFFLSSSFLKHITDAPPYKI
jgi:hypothetical protein